MPLSDPADDQGNAGTPGSSAAGPGSLTPRELEVVALLELDEAAGRFVSRSHHCSPPVAASCCLR